MIQFFILKVHFGGLHFTCPQIWIADSARRKGVQNSGLGVQNCTKWVQNYDSVFHVETAFGGLHVTSPPIWIVQEGRVYKIWDLAYKIVQNEYKILIQFFMLKLHLRGMQVTVPHSKIWISDRARRKCVQNSGLGVQNRSKYVQNYNPVFYFETAFRGTAYHQPSKF